MDQTSIIHMQPGVRGGQPCFTGTRISVKDVLGYLASGMSSDEIIVDFPELTEAHIRAAVEFSALPERHFATPA